MSYSLLERVVSWDLHRRVKASTFSRRGTWVLDRQLIGLRATKQPYSMAPVW